MRQKRKNGVGLSLEKRLKRLLYSMICPHAYGLKEPTKTGTMIPKKECNIDVTFYDLLVFLLKRFSNLRDNNQAAYHVFYKNE